MDIAAYLHRIAYRGAPDATLDTLRGLHHAHLLTAPFENLDIPLGRPIVLDEARLFDKIVTRRRGGFCYELNGLFAALLRELGFDVQLLAARVTRADGSWGIPFDHLTLRVNLDEPWLADVGFGDSFREPLRLAERAEQTQAFGQFRIADEGADRVLRKVADGTWTPQYLFALQPQRLADFADGCHYHQTSPDSPFTRRRVCTRATPDGRITLSDMKLIITSNGTKHERILSGEDERRAVLKEYFGVEL